MKKPRYENMSRYTNKWRYTKMAGASKMTKIYFARTEFNNAVTKTKTSSLRLYL